MDKKSTLTVYQTDCDHTRDYLLQLQGQQITFQGMGRVFGNGLTYLTLEWETRIVPTLQCTDQRCGARDKTLHCFWGGPLQSKMGAPLGYPGIGEVR